MNLKHQISHHNHPQLVIFTATVTTKTLKRYNFTTCRYFSNFVQFLATSWIYIVRWLMKSKKEGYAFDKMSGMFGTMYLKSGNGFKNSALMIDGISKCSWFLESHHLHITFAKKHSPDTVTHTHTQARLWWRTGINHEMASDLVGPLPRNKKTNHILFKKFSKGSGKSYMDPLWPDMNPLKPKMALQDLKEPSKVINCLFSLHINSCPCRGLAAILSFVFLKWPPNRRRIALKLCIFYTESFAQLR